MFEPEPELSPDLDWILLSGQGDSTILAKVLVNTYYLPIYRLALSILDDPKAARSAAIDSISQAILEGYRYRPQVGADVWIYQLAIESCRRWERKLNRRRSLLSNLRLPTSPDYNGISTPGHVEDAIIWLAIDGRDYETRLIVLFSYLFEWPVRKIALVLDVDERGIEITLGAMRDQIRIQLQTDPLVSNSTIRDLRLLTPDETIHRSLESRWQRLDLDQVDLNAIAMEIQKHSRRKNETRTRSFHGQELFLTLTIILVASGLIWSVNRLLPGSQMDRIAEKFIGEVNPLLAASSTAIAKNWTPTPTRKPYPPYPENALYTVLPGETIRSIARKLNTRPQILIEINRLADSNSIRSGQVLLIPNKIAPIATQAATPVTPVHPSSPLGTETSPDEVMERMGQFGSAWHTLWLDMVFLYNGPPGVNSIPQSYRLQVWLGNQQALILVGLDTANPAVVLFTISNGNGSFMASPYRGKQWFTDLPDSADNVAFTHDFSIISTIFSKIFNPYEESFLTNRSDPIRIVGTDTIAGQQAIVLEQPDPSLNTHYRIWLDRLRDFPLRTQYFYDEQPEKPVYEMLIKSIEYDVNFPQDLFDPWLPWRGGYVADHTGKPIPITETELTLTPATPDRPLPPWTPIPTDMNLADQPLRFVFPDRLNVFGSTGGIPALVEIFAGDYHVGQYLMDNPIYLKCARSQDGEWLAIGRTNSGSGNLNNADFLKWFSLDRRGPAKEISSGYQVNEFSISPDNRWLAFSGSSAAEGSRIFLASLESGEITRSFPFQNTRSLMWSPDGKYLAFLAFQRSANGDELIAINVESGQIIYHQRITYNLRRIVIDANAPIYQWGIKSLKSPGDLGDCSRAPNLRP